MEEIPQIPQEDESKNESSAEKLKSIFDDQHAFYGHGTLLGRVDEILKEGLYGARGPDIGTTALRIGRDDTEKLLNWPHYSSNAVVIIAIPANMRYSEGVFRNRHLWEETDDKTLIGKVRLPAKYIKGYVNSETGIFVGNPLFEENPVMPEPFKSDGKWPGAPAQDGSDDLKPLSPEAIAEWERMDKTQPVQDGEGESHALPDDPNDLW